MKYVYILQSEIAPDRYYVGSTVDLKRRLSEHNDGHSIHTNKFKPWRLNDYLAFDDHASRLYPHTQPKGMPHRPLPNDPGRSPA